MPSSTVAFNTPLQKKYQRERNWFSDDKDAQNKLENLFTILNLLISYHALKLQYLPWYPQNASWTDTLHLNIILVGVRKVHTFYAHVENIEVKLTRIIFEV